jgi:hypothetical protein
MIIHIEFLQKGNILIRGRLYSESMIKEKT